MGIDGKSDLMHLVSNWIEFVWIEPWHNKLVTKLNQLSLNASKCSPCHFRYAISGHRIYRLLIYKEKKFHHMRKQKKDKNCIWKQVIIHLNSKNVYFVAAGNDKNHIKSNVAVDVATNNHEKNVTLMEYCLGFVNLENR